MAEDRRVLERPAPDPDDVWVYGPGADQVADIYSPAVGLPPRPPLLLVHGGYWRPEYDRAHLRPMAHALADAGHRVVLVEYARTPGDPDASLDDVVGALRSAPDVLDGQRPILVGHSAGGHLALLAAVTAPGSATGCLALAPVADLRLADGLHLDDDAVQAYLGAPAERRPDLDPACLLRPRIPVTVIHGEADTLVPIGLSDSYCTAAKARLVRLQSTGHFELIDPLSAAWVRVLSELAALGPPSGIE